MQLVKYMKKLLLTFFCLLCSFFVGLAQDISLLEQFNGRFDYLAFGNTLNVQENGAGDTCMILTESSANLTLQPSQTVIAAYLYWAGSLDPGDFDVTLNGTNISASRTFASSLTTAGIEYNYFAAFADVTSIIQANGSGTYTLSNLDLTSTIDFYCNGNSTNFGGWAVTVVYEDPVLSLKNVSVFDGLQAVSANQNDLTIVLENLNVIDDDGAKIGFVAWEGDVALAVEETLSINGNVISNPPLNPANNAFNGTNSFTNSSELYNMDIDFYDIENNISPGDTQVTIDLTSGQDFVMINNIITVLNTELPDATIEVTAIEGGTECDNRDIEVSYTVFNTNSTAALPAATPIAFYANTTLVGQSQTVNEIPINGQETGTISLNIPPSISPDFSIVAVVDDQGTGIGIIDESNETNNTAVTPFTLLVTPTYTVQDLIQCDAVGVEVFNLFDFITFDETTTTASFHTSQIDAENGDNPIINPQTYLPVSNPETIFVLFDNGNCPVVDSFTITIEICPLPDATITLDNMLFPCRRRLLEVNYTVFNTLGTAPLPANTPISFYADALLIGNATTIGTIPIGGSETGSILLDLGDVTSANFMVRAVVDDLGNGMGIVEELDETNNETASDTGFETLPDLIDLPPIIACNTGLNRALFDLTQNEALILETIQGTLLYFETLEDAADTTNPIQNPFEYQNTSATQTIYVRLENEVCFTIGRFIITTENCPPTIPEGFSPNNDTFNDVFEISNLLDVFEDFELQIYNRYGSLIYVGGNEQGFWNGIPNRGIWYQEEIVPTGTYFYVLHLNDPIITDVFTGYVYVNY